MPPLPRAECPVCGRSVPQRVNGALREHLPDKSENRQNWTTRWCDGSGMVLPK